MAQSRANVFVDQDGRALVSRVKLGPPESGYAIRTPVNGWTGARASEPDDALVDRIHAAVDAIGGFGTVVRPGDHVTVKPNFNSGDPPPNSTDIPFLVALVRLLRDYGAARVVVGESSRHPPTSSHFEMRRTGVFEACRRAGAEVVVFGDEHWTPAPTRGRLFRALEVARPMMECDRLVFACCLKTHWLAKFSISLKLTVGAIRPRYRAMLHFGGRFDERIAEIASAFSPDLLLVDGRSAYVRGGPCYGLVRHPNVIIASGDRVALDVEGIRLLQRYRECALKENPWSYGQIRAAVGLGLGVSGDDAYRLVTPSSADVGGGRHTNIRSGTVVP